MQLDRENLSEECAANRHTRSNVQDIDLNQFLHLGKAFENIVS